MAYIKGIFIQDIYNNPSNGYMVGLIRVRESSDEEVVNRVLTFTGTFNELKYKQVYLMNGNFVTHNKYGKQFQVDTYELVLPTEEEEIIAGDLSKEMINTAKENLAKSGRTDVKFEIIDNLHLENLPKNYFDVVVARHTVTDPKQIYEVLKPNGYLLIRGVDKYDCHELKKIFGLGQAFNDITPISIIDYENVLDAKFRDVELVPIHEREYFKNEDLLYKFLLKVPILSDFSEENGDIQDFIKKSLDKEKLDLYVSKNTYPKGIRLLRRYYGIVAKK